MITETTKGRPRRAPVDRDQYRAPALEKGLEILEMLAVVKEPLNLTAIVQRLKRSTGELHRIILVLEKHGYLIQTNEGYILSEKLFRMGLTRPPVHNLVELSLPVMRELSLATHQSCHLVLPSNGDMVVVARMEARDQVGFTVRVGYRQPMYLTGSGTTLYAFQPEDIRAEWEKLFEPKPGRAKLSEFRALAATVASYGFTQQPSAFTEGVIDISAPIMRGDRAAAAIGMPYVRARNRPSDVNQVIEAVRTAANRISEMLTKSDSRV